jgi:hypothetical protein
MSVQACALPDYALFKTRRQSPAGLAQKDTEFAGTAEQTTFSWSRAPRHWASHGFRKEKASKQQQ